MVVPKSPQHTTHPPPPRRGPTDRLALLMSAQDSFDVTDPSHSATPFEAPGELAAFAAELAASRAIAADYFGDVPKEVQGGEVLAEALRSLLAALSREDSLDAWIDSNANAFANWGPDREQHLQWTALHSEYVEQVESIIAEALMQLRCTTEEVYDFARAHSGGTAATALLTRLVATSDYAVFAQLMHETHRCGGMSV